MKKISTSVFILTVFLLSANPSSLPNDPTDTLHEDEQEPLINSEGLVDEHSGTKDILDKDVEHIDIISTTQDENKVVKDEEKSDEKKYEDEEKDVKINKNSMKSSDEDKNTKSAGDDFSDTSGVHNEKESNSSRSSLVNSEDIGTENVEEVHGDEAPDIAKNLLGHPDEDQQKQTNPFKPKVMDVVKETQDTEPILSDSTSDSVLASEDAGDTKKPDPVLQKPLDFKFNNFDLYDLEVAEAEMQREKEMEEELGRKSTKNVPRDDNSEKVLDSISEEIEDKEEETEEQLDDKMESNDEGLEDSVISGYQTGSVCNYCKYCNYCKVCPKCHLCGKGDTGDEDRGHCHMCKNCKYCYLCDYLCLTICKPGGYVDVFTGTIYAVLPSFSKKAENDVSEDIDSTKDFIKEYL